MPKSKEKIHKKRRPTEEPGALELPPNSGLRNPSPAGPPVPLVGKSIALPRFGHNYP